MTRFRVFFASLVAMLLGGVAFSQDSPPSVTVPTLVDTSSIISNLVTPVGTVLAAAIGLIVAVCVARVAYQWVRRALSS